MKKMLLFALVIMASLFTGCKQRIEQAPEEVLSAFGTMFPGATHIEWSRKISTFTANFYHEQHEKQAQFEDQRKKWVGKSDISVPLQVWNQEN